MSIYTVENFTSDITVEGYIAEFRDEPHFLELCKQCTNYGKSWGCPPFDFDTESFLRQYKYAHLMATKIIPEDKDIPIEYTQKLILGEFYQFNLSSCIRQQNSLTAQFVSFSLANLANIFYPPRFLQ